MDLETQEILTTVGQMDFIKGRAYPKRYVDYVDSYKERDTNVHYFLVESERTYDQYEVYIKEKNHRIVDKTCTCPQYSSYKSCKHIAACLIHCKDEILPINQEEKNLRLSKQILERFYQAPKRKGMNLKKQIFLDVELEFHSGYYDNSVTVRFKVGETKLYSLNNKLSQFISAYINKNLTVDFGKNFTYDPNSHYLSKQDEKIINFLVDISKRNNGYVPQYINFRKEQIDILLDLLEGKDFTIVGHGIIKEMKKENPLSTHLEKEGDNYKFWFVNNDYEPVSSDYSYFVKNQTLYIMPDTIYNILSIMGQNKLEELHFKKEDLDLFSHGILLNVKNTLELDETVKDEIVLGSKPDIKIYLDFKEGMVLGNIKLDYNDTEIDYFDTNQTIIRDEELEKEVIQDLLQYGFLFYNNKMYMDDLDQIGMLLEENLIELAKKYEVFTSQKMKDTQIIKNNHVSSSFSIGQDNIMKYEFNLGNIKNDEIVDILETLKNKKKYYRLKSGDLLDLTNNEELKELEQLATDMELSNKDMKNGSGMIPKYRAVYLDSMKKDKYHIIKTNNLFDELVNKFNSYKDTDIKLAKKDKKIARDYQEIGIKWLYNIYKCGFGGILADEMGLGKSLQLIYFLKQVLKEKKDAKILIVAPTSLIYNWKNELDKFGSELKYKVFAENKSIRKEELEHIEDINILITTYGLVRQDREQYLNLDLEVVAIDEAQNIKNVHAQMTKIIKELHANTKIALTGTPLENSVTELWSIFDFIMPGYLANSMNFNKKYNVKEVDENSLKSLDSLNKQIKPFILRRKKKDVVKELPDKIENNIYIELNPEQKKLYVAQLEKTKKEMDDIIASDGFETGNFKILQLLTKLRQLCIDPAIIYENYKGGSSKIENVISLVKEIIDNGHKILLFTSYKTALDIVNKELTNEGISTYVIDGSVSSKKRMELVEKFNQDETKVFLITLKSGGTGLNLTSADVVIHLDLWWNPQVENQATDRAHRIGQKNTVEVIKLICKGTIEERILELQNKKKVLSDKLIEGKDRDQNIISKLTEKDIKHLLSMDNNEED